MIDQCFVWFWSAMVFGSVAWYGYLLFHVGIKGGGDIIRMTRALAARPDASEAPPPNQR